MAKIIITYKDRETGAYVGAKTFIGKDINEASILAANYQSMHPELKDIDFKYV